tara:strand:- start:617 stop:727 length:111 start_codon:yes stop_codon:yes gene_type:complete
MAMSMMVDSMVRMIQKASGNQPSGQNEDSNESLDEH